MRSNLINYRKRMKCGIIGALVLCHVGFFVMRRFELIPEIKQENRREQASIVVINIKPPPPKPKPREPTPEPVKPKKIRPPKPGPIVEIPDPVVEPDPVPEPSPAPVQHIPYIPRDKEPELIGGLILNYPDWARKAGMKGKAFVQALINIDGRVVDPAV